MLNDIKCSKDTPTPFFLSFFREFYIFISFNEGQSVYSSYVFRTSDQFDFSSFSFRNSYTVKVTA